jgi:hypothetical protein
LHLGAGRHGSSADAPGNEDVARTVGHAALAKRAADFPALGNEKSICHRSGDNEDIDLADQKAQQIEACARCGRDGVVDVDIAQIGKRTREIG